MVGVKAPANGVLAGGQPLVQELIVGSDAAALYPGRLVVRSADGADYVKEAGDGAQNVIGWAGIPYNKGKDDQLAQGDIIPVYNGGGFRILTTLANGQTVQKGDYLVVTTGGKVKKATQLNIRSGSTTVTSTAANGNIVDGSVPAEGIIVAVAEEDKDATAGDQPLVVRSLI
jgi:hypothetical protein